MKTRFLLFICCVLFSVLSLSAQSKSIVVLYSQNSSTLTVGRFIQEQTGADLLELKPVQPYPDTYAATVKRVRQEQGDDRLPELQPYTFRAKNYKTVYLGFPVWFGQPALPIQRFLKDNNLQGVRVIPFCTYGLGGMKSCVEWLKEHCPNLRIEQPYGLSRYRLPAAEKEVKEFMKKHTRANRVGGYTAFHNLSALEQEVFAQAMSTRKYRISYTPLKVASQVVAGTNFIFQCQGINKKGEKKPYEIKIFNPLPGQGHPEVIYIEGGEEE